VAVGRFGPGPRRPCRLVDTSEHLTPPTGSPAASHASPNGASPPARPFTGYSVRFKLLASAVVAVAVAAFGLAYLLQSGTDDDAIVRSGGTAEFVERLLPASGSQAVQQATVGIDLAPGWEGTLVVDGVEIPESQLNVRAALNRVEFAPGQGKAFTQLPSGRLCVRAIVWETRIGRAEGARTVSWCFEVV
jgi:hypothetical protein